MNQPLEGQALLQSLFQETVLARQRIYDVREQTPLAQHNLLEDVELWIKREDLGPIHSYKWRGAYNRMATLNNAQRSKGVVCASAGNHAQGVAIAANKLNCKARIFMPTCTPKMKQKAVAHHGGNAVEIYLVGDTYDEASEAAKQACAKDDLTFVHPFDDLYTMAGQGTIGDEIVMSGVGPFDVAILPVGGGGLCGAVANYLKNFWPDIEIIGVEGEGQASMARAIENGAPVALEEVDIFCDGTAVRLAGNTTFNVCKQVVDQYITVSNDQVCSAIRSLWDDSRSIVEPAGALGLAACQSLHKKLKGKRVLTLTSGANMDFAQLANIAAEAGTNGNLRRHLRITLPETAGSLLSLIETCLADINIFDFQYGIQAHELAQPVLGIDIDDTRWNTLLTRLNDANISHEDASHDEETTFRVIPVHSHLLNHPTFLRFDFPERAGALRDFLNTLQHDLQSPCSIVYFNYLFSGERVGRAIVGLEFSSDAEKNKQVDALKAHRTFGKMCHFLPEKSIKRLLSQPQ